LCLVNNTSIFTCIGITVAVDVFLVVTVVDLKCTLATDCSLKALADKVASKWQKYLQFKAEIYLAYVSVLLDV